MTLEELTQTLRMAAVNENTITAMTNAYNLGLEAGQQKRDRIQFPTMLRRMWSGGDVQAWLDEHVNGDEK